MSKETGGPAFPIDRQTAHEIAISLVGSNNEAAYIEAVNQLSQGLTIRDYFAAKAMQGMMAVPDDQRYGDRADKTLTIEQWQLWCVTGLVEHAYRMSDAMLKARK